jgi:hypothetical protein
MGLPFKKESIQDLTARFPFALKRIYDVEKMCNAGADRPGNHRENIFDFEDNTRMIVSMDYYNDTLYLHVSGSNKMKSGQELLKSILSKLQELCLRELPEHLNFHVTAGGVIHILHPLGQTE